MKELWYLHKTEYSFQEMEMVDFLDNLEKSCPFSLGWTPEAWVMNQLLLLAQANTLPMIDCHTEATGEPMGRHMFPTLPDPQAKFTDVVRTQLLLTIKENSPRLESVILIAFSCLRRGEKASFWAQFPSTQRIIHYVLKLCKLDSRLFDAKLSRPDRDSLVDSFNSSASKSCQFLPCSYEVGGQGLNLQKGSHIMVQVDPPVNMAQDQQCVGRAYRVGQLWDVHVFRLFVVGSHDDWVHNRAFNMALPDLRANLDALAFFRAVGAKIPTGMTEQQAADDLKRNMTGIFVDRDASEDKCLQHMTAFPPPEYATNEEREEKQAHVAELLQQSRVADLSEADKAVSVALHQEAQLRLSHAVPPTYEWLNDRGVFFYMYSIKCGFDNCEMSKVDDDVGGKFLSKFMEQQEEATLGQQVEDEAAALGNEDTLENGGADETPESPGPKSKSVSKKKVSTSTPASEDAKKYKVQQGRGEQELQALTVTKLKAVFSSYSLALPADQRKDSLMQSLFEQLPPVLAGSVPSGPPPVPEKRRKGKRKREDNGEKAATKRHLPKPKL